ncbi:FliC/FljB family flagellin [Chromohalobacter sp. TMW 2.2308]|uniref:FliC/FljB family flagellin n=1 Tax=Chromohalobacter TaxID=42054 RepID=UPI001FFD6AE4|nr:MULTISPECIES: FliC/FljB family flagellin [Chromohalobacter]MCK2043980.1 FliC/FljB family flagellin [Chromohalobacter moromii]MCT8515895.1 FliC/FljB family flagellin [Chromohalobacter sp. TMW 2.2271]
MAVINTNITAMIGQQNLSQSQSALSTSMERLSSGLRINSAADDAAGQAIANRMSSQINGLSQAQSNANDGISVAQTTEGALNQVNDNLQRVRELTVQAQNGTNSQEDLNSIQDEINQRLGEIDRISDETSFNGVDVLAKNQEISIQVGSEDGQTISMNLQKVDSGTLELGSFNVNGTMEDNTAADTGALDDAGFTAGTTDGGVTAYSSNTGAADSSDAVASLADGDTITSDGTTYTKNSDGFLADGDTAGNEITTAAMATELDNDGGTTSTGYTIATSGDGGAVTDTASGDTAYVNANDALTTEDVTYYEQDDGTINTESDGSGDQVYAKDDGTLTTEASSLVAGSKTGDPLASLDSAISQVDSQRSELGALQNRFDSAITNLSTTETNLTSARSRIEDADYADEVSNMTKNQILQQAGTSVLSQANQLPQNALSLLG